MERVTSSKRGLLSLIGNSPENETGRTLNFRLITETGQSAQDFTARLKSYRRWWAKPVEVSPWWCSRYGWYCVEKDLLQCVDCRKYLSAHLPSPIDDAVLHRKATNRLRGLLTDAHEKTCLWRSDITSEEACAPNVSDYELASIDFSNRAQSLLDFFPVGGEKRYLLLETALEDKVSESELVDLMEKMKTPEFAGQEISKDACMMALLGWRVDESCKECVRCDHCFRRVGLWLFRINSSTETDGGSGSLETDRQRSSKSEKMLDPISQHHKWCPWIMTVYSATALFVNSMADEESSEMAFVPTWLALFRLLIHRGMDNDAISDKATTAESFVLARQLLNETLEQTEQIDSLSGSADPSALIITEENIIL